MKRLFFLLFSIFEKNRKKDYSGYPPEPDSPPVVYLHSKVRI